MGRDFLYMDTKMEMGEVRENIRKTEGVTWVMESMNSVCLSLRNFGNYSSTDLEGKG